VFFARYRDAGGNESNFEISVDSIIDTLKGRGWVDGTAAVERWATAPGAPVLGYLERALADAGAKTVDGSWLVDRVRLVYSPRELQVLHHAAAAADEVMRVIHGELHAGMREIEIQALAQHELGKRGCEEAALRTAVRSGPLRGECHHALPTARPVHEGDIVIVDYSASFKRYHVDLLRCFAIGDPDPRWAEVLEKAAGSVDAVAAAVKPGEPMEKVVEAAKAYLDGEGIGQHAWFVGGYVQGVAIPPDWVGHVYLGGEGFERSDFMPGMMTNYENVFDIKGWPGGSCISYIDMLEMTETGIRALSHLPRTLTVV
jgi:Xaa-Pro aminopeptidase